jgi:hypothetical protein
MFLTILICSAALAFNECNHNTARSVVRVKVEQIGCSTPSTIAMTTGVNGVDEAEYARIKCEIGR